MTDTTQTTSTEKANNQNMPNWRLIQEKAYYKTNRNGQQTRETKNVEIAVGWQKVSEKGTNYIS